MQLRKPDGTNTIGQADADGNLKTAGADGANATLGAKADAAASSDTGTFSVVSFIKRALQNWTTLLAAVATGGVTVKSGAATTANATVAAAGSTSAAVNLGNARLGRISLPADIGTSTRLTFMTSHDDVTYRDLYDQNGGKYYVVAAASRSVVPDLTMFAAAQYIKVVFADSGLVASTYASERIVTLITLP